MADVLLDRNCPLPGYCYPFLIGWTTEAYRCSGYRRCDVDGDSDNQNQKDEMSVRTRGMPDGDSTRNFCKLSIAAARRGMRSNAAPNANAMGCRHGRVDDSDVVGNSPGPNGSCHLTLRAVHKMAFQGEQSVQR